MLDTIERQWHTASICATMRGDTLEDWDDVRDRFEEWLADEERPRSEEEKKRWLLGLR